jgi:hypothetical protein
MVHKNHILELNILEFSRSAKEWVVYFEIQTTPVIH